jgi:hypothetical protein
MKCKRFLNRHGHERFRWSCRFCDYELTFHAKDKGDMGFFAVHHLMSRHGLEKDDVLAYDPDSEQGINQQVQFPAAGRKSHDQIPPRIEVAEQGSL